MLGTAPQNQVWPPWFGGGGNIYPLGLIDPSSVHCWLFGTASGPWSVLFTSIDKASLH